MKRFIQLSLLTTAALALAGCSTPSRSSFETVVIDPNGNVRLYVSNQSFAISPVDIKVFIDGKRVVHGSFEVGSQHTIEEFVLTLSPGRHKIIAESSKGHAKLEQDFEVKDTTWAALAYWFDSKAKEGHFAFDVKTSRCISCNDALVCEGLRDEEPSNLIFKENLRQNTSHRLTPHTHA